MHFYDVLRTLRFSSTLKPLPIFEDFRCFTLFIRIYASKQVLHISAYCRNFAPKMKIRQIKTTSDDLRIYNLYE